MRGWQLQDGDLVLGGAGFAEVTGSDKIAQDMSIATAEPFGCDVYHPSWGSLLINYVGQTVGALTQSMISAEINRLINNYMTIQTATVNAAAVNGIQSPYAVSDLVAGVASIDVIQSYDSFNVSVTLLTAANQTVTIANTVTLA